MISVRRRRSFSDEHHPKWSPGWRRVRSRLCTENKDSVAVALGEITVRPMIEGEHGAQITLKIRERRRASRPNDLQRSRADAVAEVAFGQEGRRCVRRDLAGC